MARSSAGVAMGSQNHHFPSGIRVLFKSHLQKCHPCYSKTISAESVVFVVVGFPYAGVTFFDRHWSVKCRFRAKCFICYTQTEQRLFGCRFLETSIAILVQGFSIKIATGALLPTIALSVNFASQIRFLIHFVSALAVRGFFFSLFSVTRVENPTGKMYENINLRAIQVLRANAKS